MNATPQRVGLPVEPVTSSSTPESVIEARLAAAEAKLADAEEILGDALQSSSSWIWESDENHCFIRIIGPIEDILGTKPEKLIGKKVEDFTRAVQDPSVQNHFNTIQQRKPYRDVITSINTPKGIRFVKASGKPLYDKSGKFLGYRGTGSDVTEQVQTERRANEANRRFMEAIENVPASLMLCDREDRIVFCNSATQRYFPTAAHLLIPGTKYEDLLRAHAGSGFVAGVGKDFEGWIRERMQSHRSGNTNIVRSYSDGRWSQIIERRTSDGGIIGIRMDITELKRREAEREAARAQLREAIETMPASLVLYDHEEKILLRNNQAEKFFPEVADLLVPGTSVDHWTRTRNQRLHPEASAEEIERLVQRRLEQFRNPGISAPDQLPDGRWTQAIERRTADGGTVCVRIDVTELKRQEEALTAHSEELRRSNAELEQFAYVASHDLQEPLRMVASYCQLLQRRYKAKLDGDANEFIGFAVEGANRMQRLINDLLGYSRIGRKSGDPENFRATDALKTALANLQGAISESGAKIEFDALPAIHADRTQISQLFQNLIGNAIKFRRDGESPLIRISAAPEGGFWHFTVEDNGIGIEKEYLDRVFLIFQRLHERNKYPGTGIGLAIAKKVIEHHGGRIWIESTPGQGSKFNFTLPAASNTEKV
jgi:PAS domain S-box-containing protein